MTFKNKIQQLSKLEAKEKWQEHIVLAKSLLKDDPENHVRNHWFLTRISSSYYEARQYRMALKYAKKALDLYPNCPLALWDLAGALDTLKEPRKAIEIWKKLLRKGVEKIAFNQCGEGLRRAESLLSDCRYRIGLSYSDLGKKKLAIKYLKAHLAHRRAGLPSLYSRREIEKVLSDLLDPTSSVK